MTVLFIILGALLIVGGFACMFTPLLTFMSVSYFIMILMLVYGIFGIIQSIRFKKFGLNFVFSILSTILGLVILIFPNFMEITDAVIVYMSAAWFVVMGIVNIITSIKITKLAGSGVWVLQLIFGIFAILIGIYSFFHPMVMALSLGFLVSFYFIETGFTMLFAGIASKE